MGSANRARAATVGPAACLHGRGIGDVALQLHDPLDRSHLLQVDRHDANVLARLGVRQKPAAENLGQGQG